MKKRLAGILAPYEGERGALIPVLQQVQREVGYLPEEAVAEIARVLGISRSEIFGVLTFYAQFRTSPRGKKLVRVCRGTACHVCGGARIGAEVERQLGIKAGETTPDLEYTLETVACFGCCALSPVMVVDDTVHSRMNIAKVRQLLSSSGSLGGRDDV
jgi:NADH-quinone oxidoreductase subunit E